jgi:hypothetical protein
VTSLKFFQFLKWKLETPDVVSCFFNGRSATPIRLRQRKRVRQMPHLTDFAVVQQHLHYVKANCHCGILEQLQVIKRGLRKQPAFARVQSSENRGFTNRQFRERVAKLLGRPPAGVTICAALGSMGSLPGLRNPIAITSPSAESSWRFSLRAAMPAACDGAWPRSPALSGRTARPCVAHSIKSFVTSTNWSPMPNLPRETCLIINRFLGTRNRAAWIQAQNRPGLKCAAGLAWWTFH